MSKHVVVIAGGMSMERDVSLSSGKGAADALRELDYEVTERDLTPDIAQQLFELKPDVVFNALHGTYGEDGCLPGLLEIMGIPYTHSGVLASALAMDKIFAKDVFVDNDIPCPSGRLVSVDELVENRFFPTPYVVKPANQGSSIGVFIIDEDSPLPTREELAPFDRLMIEQFIPGIEVSVAVTDDRALGTLELAPKAGFYDYANKYTQGMTDHFCPARIPDEIQEKAKDIACKAHHILGCKGISRCDFRYNPDDNMLYLLELNTHPGLTPLSITPEIAQHAGITYNELIRYIVEQAHCNSNQINGVENDSCQNEKNLQHSNG